MHKQYFGILLGAVFVLGFALLVQASSTTGPSVTFSTDGGTEDLGVTTYVMSPRTWTVNIPSNFTKVEMAHYDKPTPDTIKKYMGWNGYSKVNDSYVWKFLSWSSATGGLIYDYAQDQQVAESTGSGLWLDATSFFQAGANTVKYYHYTGGGGIGLKIRVTTGEEVSLLADGASCNAADECQGGYCVNSYCRSASTHCGDGVCDSPETCSSCSGDCGECAPVKPTTLTFTEDATKDGGVVHYSEGGYTWTVTLPSNFVKVEIAHYDKPTPNSVKKYMGWNGYVQANNNYVWKFLSWSSATGGRIYDYVLDEEVYESTGVGRWIDATEFFYEGANTVKYYHYTEGDGIGLKIRVTTGEEVSLLADGASCNAADECQGGYCVNSYCRSASTHCGDGVCDSPETCSSCSGDCGECAPVKPTTLTFTEDATKDGGVVHYSEGGYTWTVNIPSSYVKVETAHYDKPTPNSVKKYMGWNGYLKVNNSYVWKFLSWSSATGGRIHDYVLDSDVYESTGVSKWIDATEFFRAGANTVKYYHYTEGDGIGLKIRVTTGEEVSLLADGASCNAADECQGGYCVNSYCRSASTHCGDGVCDTGETCSNCTLDCECVEPGAADGSYCTTPHDCEGGHCVHEVCRSTATYCGDKECDSGEGCSTCPSDCGVCEILKKEDGSSCSEAAECKGRHCVNGYCRSSTTYCGDGVCDFGETCRGCPEECGLCDGEECFSASECESGYCVNGYCRASSIYCGDKVCDTGEDCKNCAVDCGACEEKKKDGLACATAGECEGGYCVHNKCWSSATRCMDNHCDAEKGETCALCPEDCGCELGGCCSPTSDKANLRGCVLEGFRRGSLVCCDTKYHWGDCCSEDDCPAGQGCLGHECLKKAEPEPEPEPRKKPDGSDCSDDIECQGGHCVRRFCRSTPTYCGDGHCDKPENCQTCYLDCACQEQKCCSPTAKWADSKGCVVSNQKTKTGYVCCEGRESLGECCSDLDCPGYDKLCINHRCVAKAVCGNGYCETGKGESCLACPIDCACYNGEACIPSLERSDSYGCLRLRLLNQEERKDIQYIWCNSTKTSGQCCSDGDCSLSEQCQESLCESKAQCGDWLCQTDKGENCQNCQEDCACASRECCEPRFSSDVKGCISPNVKLTNRFICCDGQTYYGGCCSDGQCPQNEECLNHWCQLRPSCGDGKCDYNRGENCSTCPTDCRCYGADCCLPGSDKADIWGCISSGVLAQENNICCSSQIKTGDCCSNWDCSGGQECLNNVCRVPEAVCGDGECEINKGENCACSDCACSQGSCCLPSSENSNSRGCLEQGEFPSPGNVCCGGEVYRGDCCSDSGCSVGEKCMGHRCTRFIEAFLSYYYEKEVGYGGEWVKPSDAYKGIAQFYRDQATQIDIPIIALGQFVKILDTMSDATRSVVGADVIGLAIALNNFKNQMDKWYLSDPSKLQNTLLLSYSASSLLLEASNRSGTLFQDAAVRGLHYALPNNKVLGGVAQRHQAFQQKIGMNSKAAANQLFALNVADLVMDQTLLKEVDEQLRYDVLDYAQKIQLSMMASRVGELYQKAESGSLTEDEALTLLILEKEFWTAVIARCQNTISFIELEKQEWGASLWEALGANYDLTIQTETAIKQTAENWLRAIGERKDRLFREYFGFLERQGTTVTRPPQKPSRFKALLDSFVPQSIFK